MPVTPGFELRAVRAQHRRAVVLDEVTLFLPSHAHTAIVGPSGAGKSTLLRLLAGLEVPVHGEILLDGVVASRPHEIVVAPHRRGISMVFQDLALWPNLSALDNVVFGLSGTRMPGGARRERAQAVLDLVGIGQLGHRRPEALSGGEQQRVALARALAPAPAYLLLDEPFASIDLPVKARLLDEIGELSEQGKFAVLLVTHDPLEAMALCSDVVVLERGRLIESGTLHALVSNDEPRSETLQAFRAQLRLLHRLG